MTPLLEADPGARRSSAKRVAVMQPYFFPYGGYFRLLVAVDLFVVFDCVQFPRRGRVHRTEVPGPSDGREWLTLPLARQPRDVLIKDLAFAPDARARFDDRLARHSWVQAASGEAADRIRTLLFGQMGSVIDYVEGSVRLVATLLGFDVPMIRSSTLDLDPGLRGEQRVIAAATSVGGVHYINPPSGRGLYDARRFARAGLSLSYLSPYGGRLFELLPALMNEPLATIREDILASTTVEPA